MNENEQHDIHAENSPSWHVLDMLFMHINHEKSTYQYYNHLQKINKFIEITRLKTDNGMMRDYHIV